MKRGFMFVKETSDSYNKLVIVVLEASLAKYTIYN